MKLNEVISEINDFYIINKRDVEIKGISFNSKTTNDGDIFICQKGEHFDSHNFYKQAIERGCVAFLCSNELDCNLPQIVVKDINQAIAEISNTFYENPSKSLNVIGVTGTNGKTTVSHLIQLILEEAKKNCAIIGTLGYKMASCDGYKNEDRTTPMAPDMQKTLAECIKHKISTVALEVSSHALVQKRVASILFKGAVFTNLTQDHLDYHKTMEDYAKAKTILFKNISSGGFGVVNADSSFAKQFINAVPKNANKIYTYAIKNNADFMAKNIEYSSFGSVFDLSTPLGVYKLKLKMGGEFSIYNAMASVACVCQLGVDIQTAIKALEKTSGVAGRFESVATNPSVIVDYAHTPDGLENVLRAANAIKESNAKMICVFGCGGDRDTTKRPLMAKIAEDLADVVIMTNDNPRTEDPDIIINDMLKGIKDKKKVIIEKDRYKAIEKAKEFANTNDIVLIAGKGHEDYQITKEGKIYFSDIKSAKEIFK